MDISCFHLYVSRDVSFLSSHVTADGWLRGAGSPPNGGEGTKGVWHVKNRKCERVLCLCQSPHEAPVSLEYQQSVFSLTT